MNAAKVLSIVIIGILIVSGFGMIFPTQSEYKKTNMENNNVIKNKEEINEKDANLNFNENKDGVPQEAQNEIFSTNKENNELNEDLISKTDYHTRSGGGEESGLRYPFELTYAHDDLIFIGRQNYIMYNEPSMWYNDIKIVKPEEDDEEVLMPWTSVPGSAYQHNFKRISSGDFDNDGDAELVLLESISDKILIWDPSDIDLYGNYLNSDNNQNPDSLRWIDTDAGYDVKDIACGDFDGDNMDEIVVLARDNPDSGGTYDDVKIYEADGTKIFPTSGSDWAEPPTNDINYDNIEAGDFDNDGDYEIVIDENQDCKIQIWDPIHDSNDPNDLKVSDMSYTIANADHIDDIAVVDFDGTSSLSSHDEIIILGDSDSETTADSVDDEILMITSWNQKRFGWLEITNYENTDYSRIDAGDFDGDGDAEIAILKGDVDQYSNPYVIIWDLDNFDDSDMFPLDGQKTFTLGVDPNYNDHVKDIACYKNWINEEVLEESSEKIPLVPYMIVHDPNGDKSYQKYTYVTDESTYIEFSIQSSNSLKLEIAARDPKFKSGPSAGAGVYTSSSITEGVKVSWTITDSIESNSDPNPKYIGPGKGCTIWGESWEIFYMLTKHVVKKRTTDSETVLGQLFRYYPDPDPADDSTTGMKNSHYYTTTEAIRDNQELSSEWKSRIIDMDIDSDNSISLLEGGIRDFTRREESFETSPGPRTYTQTSTNSLTNTIQTTKQLTSSSAISFFGSSISMSMSVGSNWKSTSSETETRTTYTYFEDSSSSASSSSNLDPYHTDDIRNYLYHDLAYGTEAFVTDTKSYTSAPHEDNTIKADQTPPSLSIDFVNNPTYFEIRAVGTDGAKIVPGFKARILDSDKKTEVLSKDDITFLYHSENTGKTERREDAIIAKSNLEYGTYFVEFFIQDKDQNPTDINDYKLWNKEDSAGNPWSFTYSESDGITDSRVETGITFPEDTDTIIDFRPNGVCSKIIVNPPYDTVTGAGITATEYHTNPEGASTFVDLEKFVEIDATSNLDAVYTDIEIRIYYEDSDIPSTTRENWLSIYKWSSSLSQWIELSNVGFGTDGSDQYIKGDYSEFGTFAIFGDNRPTTVWVDDSYTSSSHDYHTWEYDAYNNIPDGIDAVEIGGTVKVKDGIYSPLTIDKRIILESFGYPGDVLIRGNYNGHVLTITEDWVTVQGSIDSYGFTIERSGHGYSGIYLAGTQSNPLYGFNIKGCKISDNGIGIYLDYAYFCNSPGIKNNEISSNTKDGIYSYYSNWNIYKENLINLNQRNGLQLFYSDYNSIVDHKTIGSNNWLIGSNDEHGIYSVRSDGNRIERNSISNNNFDNGVSGDGIHLYICDKNFIGYNNIYNTLGQQNGVYVYRGYNNWINYNNEIKNNNEHGIFIDHFSNFNWMKENSIFDNNDDMDSTGDGIFIYESYNNYLSQNEIYNTATGTQENGIHLSKSTRIDIWDHNTEGTNMGFIKSNKAHGILLDQDSDDNDISTNDIFLNEGDGVHFLYSDENSIISNSIYQNQGNGIYLDNSNNNNLPGIYNNHIHDNEVNGIYLSNSDDNIIESNDIGNLNYIPQGNGIYLYYSDNNKILKHKTIGTDYWSISNNNGHGVYLDNSNYNDITENNIYNNNRDDNDVGDGINLWNSHGNDINENDIRNQNSYNNQDHGIFMQLSDMNHVSYNDLYYNDINGITALECNAPNIWFNDIFENREFGILLEKTTNANTMGNVMQKCGFMVKGDNEFHYKTNELYGGYEFPNKVNNHVVSYYNGENPSPGSITEYDGSLSPSSDHPGQVIIFDSHDVTIKNIDFTFGGTAVGSVSILVAYSNHIILEGNDCSDNTKYGIALWSYNDHVTVKTNTIQANIDVGLYLYDNNNQNTIDGNTIDGDVYTWYGIRLEDTNIQNEILNNQILENYIGIYVAGGSNNNDIHDNDIVDNDLYGVYFDGSSIGNTVRRNNFIRNNGSGTVFSPSNIQAFDPSSTGLDNNWDDTIDGNYWYDWVGNPNPYVIDNSPVPGPAQDNLPSPVMF